MSQNSFSTCKKCGWIESTKTPIRKKYQDRCWTTGCGWVDTDIREHIHLHCPNCDYSLGVEGCLDYKQLKAEKTKKVTPWTGVGTLNNKAAATLPVTTRRYVHGKGYVDTPESTWETPDNSWDTNECPECPVAKENQDKAGTSKLS